MMNYILNSKNRKLKTKILHLTSRLTFGLSHVGLVEKYILLSLLLLLTSLFLPWFQAVVLLGKNLPPFYIWSGGYTGIIAPLILSSAILIFLFIFSNSRKEKLRSYILGGLSDGQLYMVIGLILVIVLLDIHRFSSVYLQFASGGAETMSGYIVAFIGSLNLWFGGYLFQRRERKESREIAYIDRSIHSELEDYAEILEQKNNSDLRSESKKDKKNMSLPI